MKTTIWFAIPVLFATLWFAFNNPANAIDPLATEVASQTWYSLSHKTKGHYCDTKNANAIVSRFNNNATPFGKTQLRKAYRVILSNC